jgi:Sortase domain
VRRALLGVPVLLAVLAGCGPGAGGTPAGAAPAPASAGKPAASAPRTPIKSPAADKFKSPRTYKQVAEPVRLRIPAIGVDSSLEQVGRVPAAKATEDAPAGSIDLPSDPYKAAWFDEGPRPGQPGPAVIVGHVSWGGPSVFVDLDKLELGTKVFVDRADGSVGEFTVTKRRQVSKSDFPTDEVYGPDLAPSLRMITCGGPYDADHQNFLDNIIVFATPV